MQLVHAMFFVMRLKACVPVYHERFSVYLDIEKSICSKSFIQRFLDSLSEFLKIQMPYCIQNFYIYGRTEQNHEDFVDFKNYLSKENMIKFVIGHDKDKSELENYLDISVIEKRMGGGMDDLTEYWPPRCYEDATKTLDENSLLTYNIVPFTYSNSEFLQYDIQTMSGYLSSSKKMLKCKLLTQN